MRNFNNINHWIAELRDVARLHMKETGITEKGIKECFCISNMKEQYDDGDSPEEAYEGETQYWDE